MSLGQLRRLVAVSVGGLAMLAIGSGAAQAATAKVTVSDKASFAGVGRPGPKPGYFYIATTKCGLLSADEKQVVPCEILGHLTVGSPTTGSATMKSADGKTTWNFVLTSVAKNTYSMAGRGVEADSADPGGPTPAPNPCVISGAVQVTKTSAGFNFTGSLTVLEN